MQGSNVLMPGTEATLAALNATMATMAVGPPFQGRLRHLNDSHRVLPRQQCGRATPKPARGSRFEVEVESESESESEVESEVESESETDVPQVERFGRYPNGIAPRPTAVRIAT